MKGEEMILKDISEIHYYQDERGKIYINQRNGTKIIDASAAGPLVGISLANATTTANGLMSAADKATLDAVAADYSAALAALGVS